MIKKLVFSFYLVFFLSYGIAQKEFFFSTMDSIPIDYRSDGTFLDSVDRLVASSPNLRPGGGYGQIFEQHLAQNLYESFSGFSYLQEKNKVIPKFSGLPYLGFQYAFGSSLTQDLNVNYHQFFKPNTHLHFRYNRQSSNAFLRNSDYKLNDVNLLFYHQKGIFATHLDAFYGSYNLHQNGGIVTDTLLDEFALAFIPVRKNDAESKIRQVDIKWDNYFRLAGDSVIHFGLKSKHRFELTHREFSELFFDPSEFDTLYIDTTGNTRDQYQTAKISNGAGFYFDSPHFKIDASANHTYWRNQNLGLGRDTNEIFLHSNLWASFGKRIQLSNEFYFNLIGATGEMMNHAQINYHIIRNLSLIGKVNFKNLYPTPYQRFHNANYYQWEIDELKMQQTLQIIGTLKYGDTNFVQADIVWTNINNGRYFINNQWRQDTLEFVSLGALQLKGAYRIKQWSFYPSITVRFNSKNFNYQPVFSTLNRFAFTTKLFKAKKLGFSVGVDIGYQTEYQFLSYNGILDLYQPVQTTINTKDLIQLNGFIAASIDQFRFFIRAENLSYMFQDSKIRIDQNYPIAPLIFRLGITWDFFN